MCSFFFTLRSSVSLIDRGFVRVSVCKVTTRLFSRSALSILFRCFQVDCIGIQVGNRPRIRVMYIRIVITIRINRNVILKNEN